MNLHSPHPYWSVHDGLIRAYPPLERDVRCDVAIVGGGITGAMVADALVSAGVSCVVVDRRDIGLGSTCASTGLLQYELDTPLFELEQRIESRMARRAYRLGVTAIRRIASLCARNTCEFAWRPSLLLARTGADLPDLARELRARESARLDVTWLDRRELKLRYGLDRPAAIRSGIAAEVNPYRLTHCLFGRGIDHGGLQVFDRTRVIAYDAERNGVVLHTDRHHHIAAKAIFFASGYETKSFLPRRIVRIKSTYATISEPLSSSDHWPERSLLWEVGAGYMYARTTCDGRIIVGGEDDDVVRSDDRDRQLSRKAARLRHKLSRLRGSSFESAFTWAGPFGYTKDGLAYIGAHSAFPRALFALGFGGNGITFSAIASVILRDNFLKKTNRDAGIFAFER